MFREPAVIKSPLIRSFSRVFVLVQIGPRAFQIANETVHIKNATTKETEVSMWYQVHNVSLIAAALSVYLFIFF